MQQPKRICVFCGSSRGVRRDYVEGARALGREIAQRGIDLVYGGSDVGLMGALADSAMEAGGHVVGVIPEALVDLEVAHAGLPDLRIVQSMHERKALMAELSGAFVAMPGGLGTLEELFEVLTWAQLGIHAKPCGLLNVAGYFDPVREMLGRAVDEGFLRSETVDSIGVEADVASLLDRLAATRLPEVPKWIDLDQS